MWVAATGTAAIERFEAYGPLAAAFLVNLLATFGDKGQLVVVTLASRYDATRVFAGAMGAFALWSAVEVALGQRVATALPGAVVELVTGAMFLAFGLVTVAAALRKEESAPTGDIGPPASATVERRVPARVLAAVGAGGGVGTSFVFVLFAEFGDKTQLLTINLAAAFPEAPLSVFLGVVGALALRTGVDATIGDRFERRVPTGSVRLAAGVVFVAFGLQVLGVVPVAALLAVVVAAIAFAVGSALRDRSE